MKKPENDRKKVFISYSTKDRAWVKDFLIKTLEENGIRCYIDYRDFEGGALTLLNIERAIETCEKTILVYSPNWETSHYARLESAMLQTLDPDGKMKKMIPIMLEKCEIPLWLEAFTYYDFTNKDERHTQIQRVITQIKKDFAEAKPEKPAYSMPEEKYIDITRIPETGFELYGRQKELKTLNKAWEDEKTHVISYVAYGGVGKSTLIKKWCEKMRWENFKGAERVFAWSFYSQGTKEYVTSADMFMDFSLRWFGDPNPESGSPWDKGKRLAKLINNHKTLLILDGLEPLQSGLDVEKGKIKDPGLSVLVRELVKYNRGLCIITTRVRIPELDRYKTRIVQENLEQISDEAGVKLLELSGVRGKEDELTKVVKEFGNHALAINLLGQYLYHVPGYTVEKAFEIPGIDIPMEKGEYPRRIIQAFAEYFGTKSPEYELLSILGLFDRPVDKEVIDSIIGDTPIPGLTTHLSSMTGDAWYKLLEKLREYKLLIKKSKHRPGTLDCHPLIREHFGEKLEKENLKAWKQAHGRLYEYYKNLPEKEYPDTLKEMEPLFAAVRHGCLAGRHQEVIVDMFWKRISRNNEDFIVTKLGAYGVVLACESNFFESPWDKPAFGLAEKVKPLVLGWAGFALRAVGRLKEAIQPMKAGLEMFKKQNNMINAAKTAGNLSELFLTMGIVREAIQFAEESVEFADKSGDKFQIESKRTALADTLHQAGRRKDAESLFNEAEYIQKKWQPEYPYLCSLQGFQYCDLLLSQSKYEVVLKKARITLEWGEKINFLLDIALDNLSIGKALILKSIHNKSFDFLEAEEFLNKAVNGLREAGTQDHLPRSLLARAILYRYKNQFTLSWEDLDEVKEIAEYGGMKLYLIDYNLEACRVISSQLSVISNQGGKKGTGEDSEKGLFIIEDGERVELTVDGIKEKFGEFLRETERLIGETGYHRRDGELAELKELGQGL